MPADVDLRVSSAAGQGQASRFHETIEASALNVSAEKERARQSVSTKE